MNDAFIASLWKEELMDTLFFSGLNTEYTREMTKGKKTYVFNKNKDLILTITGRSIVVNGNKFTNTRAAKQYIVERFL